MLQSLQAMLVVSLLSSPFAMQTFASQLPQPIRSGTPAPQPTEHPTPPPPAPVSCRVNCDAWEPNYPSTCAAPFVYHQRQCQMECGENEQSFAETNCIPLADYSPMMMTSDDLGGKTETESFTWDSPCKGQWVVNIVTTFLPDNSQGMTIPISSRVDTECNEN